MKNKLYKDKIIEKKVTSQFAYDNEKEENIHITHLNVDEDFFFFFLEGEQIVTEQYKDDDE